MNLGAGGGVVISLLPVRYQFPGMARVSPQDWDANWLVVRGDVRIEGGRVWSFTDPCLTTWEAAELGEWLRGVVSGDVEPVSLDGGVDEDQLLAFTEPNVAFSLASRGGGGEVVLRVHLSLEARAPVLDGQEDGLDLYEYFVLVASSAADLAAAASTWDRELAPFPVR